MQKHRKECARYAIQLNSLRALLLLVRDTAIITSFRVASFFFSLTLLCQVCLFLTLSRRFTHYYDWRVGCTRYKSEIIQDEKMAKKETGGVLFHATTVFIQIDRCNDFYSVRKISEEKFFALESELTIILIKNKLVSTRQLIVIR